MSAKLNGQSVPNSKSGDPSSGVLNQEKDFDLIQNEECKDDLKELPSLVNDSQLELAEESEQRLRKRGRKPQYKDAEHPELIDKAKMILPNHDYDIDALLSLDEFKPLKTSRDLPRFVSKYILNKTAKSGSKSVVGPSQAGRATPSRVILELGSLPQAYVPFQKQLASSVPSTYQLTPQANYGAKISSEVTSNYLRDYMRLRPCERYQFLEKMCERNSQSLLQFLINLKTTCAPNFFEGMFGLIHELNINSALDLQIKTRLFVQSLLYYRDEVISIEDNLLKNAMNLLALRPNSEQTLGLANYIFINEIENFSQLQEQLILLDSKNMGIVPLMVGTFASFEIDPQVIRLLPNTLQCLNKPFIQILKQDHGLRLIREIPINLVGDFVQICALCQAKNYLDLDNMASQISEIFIQKWDYLDHADFSLLIAQLSVELKERNQNWLSKIDDIVKVVNQVTDLQIEKGIRNRPDIIADLISCNQSSIKQILKRPKLVDDFSNTQFYKLVGKFKKLNPENSQVEDFCNDLQESRTQLSQYFAELEKQMGFNFLSLQKLCINFLRLKEEQYQFINFGIGNGKTLICSIIALILCKENKAQVILLGKNDYLVLRDEKRFQSLMASQGVNSNYNQHENRPGLYYMTQKYLDSQRGESNFINFLSKSTLIIDEFDWLIFEGSASQMQEEICFLRKAERIIGLTGSTLTLKEKNCIEAAFNSKEICFPSISTLCSDKKIHHPDILMTTTQAEFCKALFEVCLKQTLLTPVIIVAGGTYQMIENYFRKFKEIEFFSMKGVRGSKVDAQFEGKFNIKNQNKRFGVYLLSELQGRGTDLQTSKEIEENGGLYLLISNIFSLSSTQQIIGRVGRLHNKGQFRHYLLITGSQDTVEQAIQFRQDFLENEQHIKFSKLQTLLAEERVPEIEEVSEKFEVNTDLSKNVLQMLMPATTAKVMDEVEEQQKRSNSKRLSAKALQSLREATYAREQVLSEVFSKKHRSASAKSLNCKNFKHAYFILEEGSPASANRREKRVTLSEDQNVYSQSPDASRKRDQKRITKAKSIAAIGQADTEPSLLVKMPEQQLRREKVSKKMLAKSEKTSAPTNLLRTRTTRSMKLQ